MKNINPDKVKLIILIGTLLLGTFMTSVSASGFKFAVFGETRSPEASGSNNPEAQSEKFMALISQVISAGPDLVINVGDAINGYWEKSIPVKSGKRNPKKQRKLETARYLSAIQPLSDVGIKSYLVPGNHDISFSAFARRAYWRSFNHVYASFNYKKCTFIILNTEDTGTSEGGKGAIGARQYSWLNATLKKSLKSKFRFVFMHRPIFPADNSVDGKLSETDRKKLHALFIKYKVNMVFASRGGNPGSRTEKDGVEYYTVGISGEAAAKGEANYLIVSVDSDEVQVERKKLGNEKFRVPDGCVKSRELMELSDSGMKCTIVPANDFQKIHYKGQWDFEPRLVPGLSPGCMFTEENGAAAVMDFTGTSVSVITGLRFDHGFMEVSIDNGPAKTISLIGPGCSASAYLDYPFTASRDILVAANLKPGRHQLKIKFISKRDKIKYKIISRYEKRMPLLCMRLYGVKYGNYGFASLTGKLQALYDVPVEKAEVVIAGENGKFRAFTGHDGVYSISGIPGGEYTVSAVKKGMRAKNRKIKLEPGTESKADFIMACVPGNPLYGKIIYPSPGVPVIVKSGSGFDIEYIAENGASGWKAALVSGKNDVPLEISPEYRGDNVWIIPAVVPANCQEGLYTLRLVNSRGTAGRKRSVEVIREFKQDFTVAVLDSIEEDYRTLNKIIARLNKIRPAFVILLGDNVANPINLKTAKYKYRKLMRALEKLQVPSFVVSGNHDVGSHGELNMYGPWLEYVGKPYFSFNYGECHFQGISTGSCQVIPPEIIQPKLIEWMKKDLAAHRNDALRINFRHMVLIGYIPSWHPGWERTLKTDMVLYGHYGQNKKSVKGKTVYLQTPDVRKHGYYRIISIKNGKIASLDKLEEAH